MLTCEAAGDLDAFLQQHRPTVREAEQICVWRGGVAFVIGSIILAGL